MTEQYRPKLGELCDFGGTIGPGLADLLSACACAISYRRLPKSADTRSDAGRPRPEFYRSQEEFEMERWLYRWYGLPFRLLFWWLPFLYLCFVFKSMPLVSEYISALEILPNRRARRRCLPLREWFVCYMRFVFPELR